MASSAAAPTPQHTPAQRTPAAGQSRAAYESFIEKQLDKTRTRLKLIDLAGGLLTLAACVLIYLLAVAVVDHWLFGLGLAGRLLALAGLAGGVVYFVVVRFGPLVVNKINPAFAARVIERSQPSLKNSLINFLTFRPYRGAAPAVVYQALQQKAAADLSQVDVENTIDRSPAIKMGYVLAGVFALCALYSVASPKSTWQTIRRVALPLSDISRPSRVSIENVEPGDAEVFLGQPATISALVSGSSDRDKVRVVYSTADGQIVERQAEMHLAAGGRRYELLLPEQENLPGGIASSGSGLQQDVTYRVLAGDAVSPAYRLKVLPAPAMFVERIEYDYPPYTKNPRQVKQNEGDIKALEGTRVTIQARANHPIQTASIEFRRAGQQSSAGSQAMQFDGQSATVRFTLQLDGDRDSPRYDAYELRFVTPGGHRNETPSLHRLEVLRDLSPEVAILTPQALRTQVPENGSQVVEIRAVDPDFALYSVALEGAAAGADVIDELLLQGEDRVGQQVFKYNVEPRKLGLVAGDVLTFWAIAKDNRTSPSGDSPAPNVARTRNYVIEITPSPAPNEPRPDDPENMDERPEDMPPEDDPSRRERPKIDQQEDSPAERKRQNNDEPNDSRSGDQQQKGQGGAGGGAADPQQSEQQNAGNQKGGSGESSSSQPGDDSQAGDQSGGANSSKQPGGDSQKQSGNGGAPSGDSVADGENRADQPQEKLHDGEVFDRALKHIEKQQQQNNEGASNDADSDQSGEPGKQQQSGRQPSNNQASPDGADQQQGKGGNASAENQDSAKPAGASAGDDSQPKPDAGRQGDGNQNNSKQGDGKQGEDAGKSPDSADSKSADSKGADSKNADSSGGESGEKGEQSPEANPGSQKGAAQQSDGAAGRSGEKQDMSDKDMGDRGESSAAQPQPGGEKGDGAKQPDNNEGAGAQKQGSQGDSGASQKNGAEADRGEKPDNQDGGDAQRKDPGAGDSSDSGAGSASENTAGSPGSNQANADKPKDMQPDSNKPENSDEAQSPSNSKKQSDSQGGQGGDESGGGKQGGGQGANQKGNDGAGSNSSADSGAGASSEAGAGETSSSAGDQQQSKGATGNSGDQRGAGSKSSSGEQGSQSGGSAGGESPANGGKEQPQKSDQPGKSAGSGSPRGGQPDGQSTSGAGGGPQGEVADGDKANLDYARQATDLVLEHLEDQSHDPDPELLEKLQMSPAELREFVQRWRQWKRSAQRDDDQSRQLDEALRSLGLRKNQGQTRRDAQRSDGQRSLRDEGSGEIPLPAYRDLFRDYKKGAARAGSDR